MHNRNKVQIQSNRKGNRANQHMIKQKESTLEQNKIASTEEIADIEALFRFVTDCITEWRNLYLL